MTLRRLILAAVAAAALMTAPGALASPYYERCGDGTPHGCLLHCFRDHGGIGNLDECYKYHYLV